MTRASSATMPTIANANITMICAGCRAMSVRALLDIRTHRRLKGRERPHVRGRHDTRETILEQRVELEGVADVDVDEPVAGRAGRADGAAGGEWQRADADGSVVVGADRG